MLTDSAVLFDVTKCIGCGSCTVACKMWNDLSFESGNAHGYDVSLDENTWTTLEYNDTENASGESVLRFFKHQCMHCMKPTCVSVCFAKAIQVTDSGAVVYDPKKCVGCRYCMIGCPYDIPKYEWGKVFPSVMKCRLCAEKLEKNQSPSCVSVCPSGALTFGSRELLLLKARTIIDSNPQYIKHIYGEHEGGGTRWLYISDTPFENLGLPANVPEEDIPSMVHTYSKKKPAVFAGAALAFVGLELYTHRRLKVKEAEKAKKEAEDTVKEDNGDV